MAFATRHEIAVTTAADGSATVYSPPVNGPVLTIRYIKDGSTPLASTSDFTITAEATGEAILTAGNVNASATYAPRQPVITVANAAIVYATGAAGAIVTDHITLADDRVKIAVAQGGNATVGTFHVTVGGS